MTAAGSVLQSQCEGGEHERRDKSHEAESGPNQRAINHAEMRRVRIDFAVAPVPELYPVK